jgi:3-phytase
MRITSLARPRPRFGTSPLRSSLDTVVASTLIALGMGACGGDAETKPDTDIPVEDAGPPPIQVTASVEIPSTLGDPDDGAIWVHPTDSSKSRILTTDKTKGLFVHDLEGKQLQSFPGFELNNVDLRYGFQLGGKNVALVAATDRKDDSLAFFLIDEETGEVSVAPGSGFSVGEGSIFPVYGGCMYRSPEGETYAFVNTKGGAFKQFKLGDDGAGSITASSVRIFGVGSQPEGCAVDDQTSTLYLGEEGRGLHRLDARPDGPHTPALVDGVEGGRLTPDVEGVAIYRTSSAGGYILVSSQGSDTVAVYELDGINRYLASFHVGAGEVDEVTHTDGIDVTHAALSPAFPQGLFLIHDDRDDLNGKPAFKLVPWERIAEAMDPPLMVDTTLPVRPK